MKGSRTMLIVSILMSVSLAAVAQLTLKSGMDRVGDKGGVVTLMKGAASSPLVWLGLALFGLSALVWLVVLSKASLSFAYPFASLTYAIIIVADRFVLHQHVPPARWAGVAVIITGILLVATTMGSSVGAKG
jgi:drug/metabolite transporter (DMT)-like permease